MYFRLNTSAYRRYIHDVLGLLHSAIQASHDVKPEMCFFPFQNEMQNS